MPVLFSFFLRNLSKCILIIILVQFKGSLFPQAKSQLYMRTHMADESKNEYAAQLQNFNAEQWKHFNVAIPQIFKVIFITLRLYCISSKCMNGYHAAFLDFATTREKMSVCLQNLQEMDERRTVKLGETYRSFAEVERKVIPIISKCLEGMVTAAKNVDERKVQSDAQIKIFTASLRFFTHVADAGYVFLSDIDPFRAYLFIFIYIKNDPYAKLSIYEWELKGKPNNVVFGGVDMTFFHLPKNVWLILHIWKSCT